MDRHATNRELETLFSKIVRKTRKELNEVLRPWVPHGDFIVLRTISRCGPINLSRLSGEFDVSTSHITAVTNRLVEKGYLTRERSTEDRRVVNVAMTGAGQELLNQMTEKKQAYMDEKFKTLTDDDVMSLKRIFEKLL